MLIRAVLPVHRVQDPPAQFGFQCGLQRGIVLAAYGAAHAHASGSMSGDVTRACTASWPASSRAAVVGSSPAGPLRGPAGEVTVTWPSPQLTVGSVPAWSDAVAAAA